jgi:hypothetical protein
MPRYFRLYSSVAATAFVYKWFPETKGRSLEDMDVLFSLINFLVRVCSVYIR